MNVAQLDDLETIKGVRQAGERNSNGYDVNFMALDLAGIERQTGGGTGSQRKEVPAGQ
jgi:hypothetical protein